MKSPAPARSGHSMDHELRHAIEDFFYLEAELLDDRRLREWLDLLTDDVHYWMPIRHNPLERPADLNDELSKPGEAYYFNDTKKTLERSSRAGLCEKRLGRDAAIANPSSGFQHSR